jgi:hypothetical protein
MLAALLGRSSVVMAAVGGGIDGNTSNTTMATRVLLDPSTHPHARCLDGSVAAMYVRPGWGSGASVWNLFQEGGGSCHSLSDCARRAQTNQGSSSSWPAAIDLVGKFGAGGIYFSPDPVQNPLLWNANVAYLVYCDGGAFSGDNSTTAATVAGLHFRGQAIIRAAIETLAATTTLSAATAVVISGCSEGGVATFAHLDWMASLVRAAAPTVAKIAGLADSGYYPADGSPTHTYRNSSSSMRHRTPAAVSALAASRPTPRHHGAALWRRSTTASFKRLCLRCSQSLTPTS